MASKSSYIGPLSPEFALLGLLQRRPAHGYELHSRLAADLGQIWHISLSQTYNILKRLEAQGYIEGALHEQDKLPARRLFHLTPSGQERFDSWLNTSSGCSVRAIRVEFTTRLYFASEKNRAFAADLIQNQEDEIRQGLQRLRASLDEIPPMDTYNRLGLSLRISQLESILGWLDECRQMLLRS